MFTRVAWHVQGRSSHVLHVNGQVLVCVRAYTTHELGAVRNSWRARIPGRRPAGRPAALHQEFLKNTRVPWRGKREEPGTSHCRRSSCAVFSATQQVVEGHPSNFHTLTHTHSLFHLQLVAMRSPLLRVCCAGDPSGGRCTAGAETVNTDDDDSAEQKEDLRYGTPSQRVRHSAEP